MRVSGYVPVIHSEDGLKQNPTIYTSSIKKNRVNCCIISLFHENSDIGKVYG